MTRTKVKTPALHAGCDGGHEIKNLIVLKRRCNYSAFNGYHRTPSDYSTVKCTACNFSWRTKASYVESLKDGMP